MLELSRSMIGSLDKLRSLSRPIAFSNYSKNGDLGGVTTWLESLLRRLHDDGVPVVLLLFHYGADISGSGIWSRLSDAGIPVEIVPLPVEEETAHPERFVRLTLEFLNRHTPQLFLPNCRNSFYFAARIAGRQGLPWVFTVHSDDPLFWDVAQAIQVKANNGAVVGVSGYIGEQAVVRKLDNSPRVIPYGVPVSNQSTSFSDEPFRVVYSGRIVEEQKRISLVLQAMALACGRDSRIECWLIGDGPELESSRVWVEDQGLADRIHFSGRLDVPEVRQRMSQFQAVLLMSDYEGLGISLLEAMACNVVPVARMIRPITEFVIADETGLLVDASPDQAARALTRLVDDPGHWSHCSKRAGLLVANTYSEDRSYERWVDYLADSCGRFTVSYPLRIPGRLPIPSRYHPATLRWKTALSALKWKLIKVFYSQILPLAVLPRTTVRRLFVVRRR